MLESTADYLPLFFQLNNVNTVNKADIIERIERELDSFKD
jgi:hypothetical protein